MCLLHVGQERLSTLYQFFIFERRIRIYCHRIWKNISSSTSPSPPRYLNWAPIFSLIAINTGRRCCLNSSMLQSRSWDYPRSRNNQLSRRCLVGNPTSLTSTYERWPPTSMYSSLTFFTDRRKFFKICYNLSHWKVFQILSKSVAIWVYRYLGPLSSSRTSVRQQHLVPLRLKERVYLFFDSYR